MALRALVVADIPTLNQNTTGNAANVTGIVAVANGGTGAATAAANTVFGNFTGSSAAPGFTAAPTFSAANLTNFPTFNQNTSGTAAGLSTSAGPNFFLATPVAATGAPSLRAMVANDLPATLNASTFGGNLTLQNGHLVSTISTAPTIAVQTGGAGTGATATLVAGSTDVCGTIVLTTGTGPTGGASLVSLTFSTAYAAAPKAFIGVGTQGSTASHYEATADLQGSAAAIWPSTSTTGLSLASSPTAPTTSTIYCFNYLCIG